jgi:asparagine synthase (glutamine-hydrolysing)
MCGLAGFLQQPGSSVEDMEAVAVAMARRMRHRGPDDRGAWSDPDAGFAVAHRRLSIIELSPAGHQPMRSASGRWVLAYNGEIYNHLELRARLAAEGAAPKWHGRSDSETLLAAVDAWGVAAALQRSVGMFAIALWDRTERCLWLARDRMGEKPMYYGWQGDSFLFGSELKAFDAHPDFEATIDRRALALLLRFTYVPSPHCIYAGIRKLAAGHLLCVHPDRRDERPSAYWSFAQVAQAGAARPFEGSDADAVAALENVLGRAVRGQMMSDVPLGALLSGGIDSSAIVALMQANTQRPVQTFTIGFDEHAYDEAAHARQVASFLGTDHHELCLGAADALALIPSMPEVYDEPIADSSQLPTNLVMRLARTQVTVALSGDGGDELFGGYQRYTHLPQVWRSRYSLPAPLRHALGHGITALPRGLLNQLSRPLVRNGGARMGDRAQAFGARLKQLDSIDDLYLDLVSQWDDMDGLVVDAGMPDCLLDDRDAWPVLDDPSARMMALDSMTHLPDDLLVKVDRAAMAASLETRAPFLDRDVVEFACSLPMSMKLRDGQGKWVLRKLLERHVPAAITERPKMGFSIPLDEWLRGPLREWAEDLLDEGRLQREGFISPGPVRAAWRRHLNGDAPLGKRLWTVLMFQAWLAHQDRARWDQPAASEMPERRSVA